MRTLSYAQAIREAHAQLLASDERVFVIGQGLWSPWYAGTTLQDLEKEFGRDRMLDTPVSENATTGAAIGAAVAGMRPIVFHPRMDFMLLAVDPIVNQAANWSYMFGGQVKVPLVIRSVVNRGGEQGAQHSQAVHAFFAHLPGLQVAVPATPYDAKGLLIEAVESDGPVLYIDDRWLYGDEGHVPEEPFRVQFGKAQVLRDGTDVTLLGISYMTRVCLEAADELADASISAEVIDLRTLKPWDVRLVCLSVAKTGRLLVADGGWRSFGVSAEIAATVTEEVFESLKAPVARVALPDAPAPTSLALERAYYPDRDAIVVAVQKMMTL